KIAARIALRRRFDFDHTRPQVREQRSRVGAGDEGRALDNGDIFDDVEGHRLMFWDHVTQSASPRRHEDFVAWKVVHDLGAVLRHHQHIFQSRASRAGFAFARFHGYGHAFFEHLRVIKGPEPVDDGNIVTGAGAKPDAVANLAGKDLYLAFVSPFGRRREVLRRVGRRFAPLYFVNDSIDTF